MRPNVQLVGLNTGEAMWSASMEERAGGLFTTLHERFGKRLVSPRFLIRNNISNFKKMERR